MANAGNISDRASGPRGIAQMLHGLNNLRTFATILVVLGHAAIPYMATPIRTLIWPAHDAQTHLAFDLLGLWTSGFVMPLFFLMSGISAGPSSLKSTMADFIGTRTVRLIKPFLFASLIIMPVCYAIFGVGMLLTERVTFGQLIRLRFAPELQGHLFGPAHLWFLEYLLIVSIAWCLLTHAAQLLPQRVRTAGDRALLALAAGPWRVLALAVCVLSILALEPDTCIRIQNSFIPDPYRLLYYGVFFTLGAWIAKLPDPVRSLQLGGRWYAFLWPIFFACLAPVALRHLETPVVGWDRVWLVTAAALSGSTAVCALLAFGAGMGNRKLEWSKYLSESSFWTYLFHVPAIAAAQVALLHVPIPAVLKFALSAAFSLGLSLVTFEYCVRYSRLGLFVLGVRKRAGTKGLRPEMGWIGVGVAGTALVLAFVGYHHPYFFARNLHAVPEHRLIRVNRMSPAEFQTLATKTQAKSVIIVSLGGDHEDWFKSRHDWCDAHGVFFGGVEVKDEEIPTPERLVALADLFEKAPRPILIEGHRSPALTGFGAAFAILMEGGSPEESLRQFDRRYFQLEGPEHTLLAKVIHRYRRELETTGQAHSPAVFRDFLSRPHPPAIAAEGESETVATRRAMFGAPRYPLQLR